MSNFIYCFNNSPIANMDLPIRIKLSFIELIDFWEKKLNSSYSFEAKKAKMIIEAVNDHSGIREEIEDFSTIGQFEEVIRLLTDDLFPPLLSSNEIKALTVPFLPYYIRPTLRLEKLFENLPEDYDLFNFLLTQNVFYGMACIYVLNAKFNLGFDLRKSFYTDFPNKQTGFTHHLQFLINGDFSKVIDNENSHKVQVSQLSQLPEHFIDVAAWKKLIPPNSFDFVGFTICNFFDATVEYCSRQINADLLRKNALNEEEILADIAENLQNVLHMRDITIGFLAYEPNENSLYRLEQNKASSILLSNEDHLTVKDFLGEQLFNQLIHKKFWLRLILKAPIIINLLSI